MPAVHDLGLVEIPESLYKGDLALLDRYQGFSTELLRLSLAGVAVFGFLLDRFEVSAPPTTSGGTAGTAPPAEVPRWGIKP